MAHHVENFLNGYNINFLTFGQTGSGKTYTILAPTATFKNYKGSPDINVSDIPAEFGLCSRALYNIWEVVKDDPNCLLTVSALQVGMMAHMDLVHNTPLKLDWKQCLILGGR